MARIQFSSKVRLLRRLFLSTCVVSLSGCILSASAQTLTEGEAWARIQHLYGGPPSHGTVDTLKAGDPSVKVTGITTTFLDTMDVLREAVRRGDNLIITHEPTFYNHMDDVKGFAGDAVYQEKRAFIEQHHLVVYRLHDEIHARPGGDEILDGLYKALGWEQYPHRTGPSGENFVTVPKTTLGELSAAIRARLHDDSMRIVGDPKLEITQIAVLPGSVGLTKQVWALSQPGVELLIAGEASEWETVEYARDASAQGRSKALMLLGHEVSEEPGMELCARDLRVLFPGVRVDHIVAGPPLRSPGALTR